MIAKRSNIDWLLIIGYLLLVAIGWLAIYTAGYNEATPDVLNLNTNYGKQIVWIGVALLVVLVTQILDTRFYTAFAYLIYGLCILLLILVLLFGSKISGSRSWFSIGFIRLQPAEFAKFATCLALAKYVGSLSLGLNDKNKQLAAAAIIAIPALLIIMQGDAGSAIVFFRTYIRTLPRGAFGLVFVGGRIAGGVVFGGIIAIV